MQHKPTTRDTASIAALVSRLLSHYWTAADGAASRQAQIEDWIEDLIEFPLSVIVEACARWRRQPGGRRPTPGDIRTYCFEEQCDYGTGQARLGAAAWDREAYARSCGWSSWLERQDAIDAAHLSQQRGLAEQAERASELRRVPGFAKLDGAAALGVKAREWTAEELRRGREALGLGPRDYGEPAS